MRSKLGGDRETYPTCALRLEETVNPSMHTVTGVAFFSGDSRQVNTVQPLEDVLELVRDDLDQPPGIERLDADLHLAEKAAIRRQD